MIACSGGMCSVLFISGFLKIAGDIVYTFILEMTKRQSPKLGHSRWHGHLAGCELWNCINQEFCLGTVNHIVTHSWCPCGAESECRGRFSIFGQNLQIKRIYVAIDNFFVFFHGTT